MDVHINLDQSAQSEPRIRLQLAENLLRETQSLIQRLEVCNFPYIEKMVTLLFLNNQMCFLNSNGLDVIFVCLLS